MHTSILQVASGDNSPSPASISDEGGRSVADLEAEEEQVRLVREAAEARRKTAMSASATDIDRGRAERIEQFVAENRIAEYPAEREDLVLENKEAEYGDSPFEQAILDQVKRALAHEQEFYEAGVLTGWILNSMDVNVGTDLSYLPASSVTACRILAHIETLGITFSPRLAVTMARRIALVLMNHPSRGGQSRSAAPEQEDACFDCGGELGSHADSCPNVKPGTQHGGLKIVGFYRALKDISLVDGILRAGRIVEKLKPGEREQSTIAFDKKNRGKTIVVIWWQGKPRMIDQTELTSVERQAFEAQGAQDGS